MTGSFGHGWSGIAIIYGLSTGGLYGGLRLTQQHAGRVLWVLTYSLPVMVGSMLVTTLITEGTRSLGQGVPEILKGILGLMVLVFVSGITGIVLIRRGERAIHQRGTRLIDALPRRRAASTAAQVAFARQPVPLLDETKHFKVIGTTGTGKTTVIRELLTGALGRGQRAVIADPDAGYLKAFLETDRGDVILNPFDPRSCTVGSVRRDRAAARCGPAGALADLRRGRRGSELACLRSDLPYGDSAPASRNR